MKDSVRDNSFRIKCHFDYYIQIIIFHKYLQAFLEEAKLRPLTLPASLDEKIRSLQHLKKLAFPPSPNRWWTYKCEFMEQLDVVIKRVSKPEEDESAQLIEDLWQAAEKETEKTLLDNQKGLNLPIKLLFEEFRKKPLFHSNFVILPDAAKVYLIKIVKRRYILHGTNSDGIDEANGESQTKPRVIGNFSWRDRINVTTDSFQPERLGTTNNFSTPESVTGTTNSSQPEPSRTINNSLWQAGGTVPRVFQSEELRANTQLLFDRMIAAARWRMGNEFGWNIGSNFFRQPRKFHPDIEEWLEKYYKQREGAERRNFLFSADWANEYCGLSSDAPLFNLRQFFLAARRAAETSDLFMPADKNSAPKICLDLFTEIGKKLFLLPYLLGMKNSDYLSNSRITDDDERYFNSESLENALRYGGAKLKDKEELYARGNSSAQVLAILETGSPTQSSAIQSRSDCVIG